ncbi:MAG: hypothetical protein K0S25_145 [Bacillus sp. (in: firmicutes)]|jgi:hypothetical protein|nr:hypothetical protein [Bacillus sp. (in: firmicutes)]
MNIYKQFQNLYDQLKQSGETPATEHVLALLEAIDEYMRSDTFTDAPLFDELMDAINNGNWKRSEVLFSLIQRFSRINKKELFTNLKLQARLHFRRTGQTSGKTITLSVCGHEVQMLKSLSNSQLDLVINKMGFEQLVRFNYVLQVLDQSKGTPTDFQTIIQLLTD